MLHRIPRQIPDLQTLLDDLGRPRTESIARALGVSPSTARRWVAAGNAPRSALLALFWLTRWGHSAVDADCFNDGQAARVGVDLVTAELATTKAQLVAALALNPGLERRGVADDERHHDSRHDAQDDFLRQRARRRDRSAAFKIRPRQA
jgi:hypothetical protein